MQTFFSRPVAALPRPLPRHLRPRRAQRPILTCALACLLLSGCASVNFDDALGAVNQDQAAFTQGHLELSRSAAQQEARSRSAQALLAQPLGQAQAVQLALVNSPALQALLAQNWADAAAAAQLGRIANPTLSFERATLLDEVELSQRLAFGLLDLLSLPLRQGAARRGLERAQLQLAATVVEQVTQLRQAWVQAVAAQQSLGYAQQVLEAAQASAELAQRMHAVGNFSKLEHARQQLFSADASTQLALAQNAVNASRETLVRLLGLSDAQAAQLQLPERLPDLPQAPRTPDAVGHSASQQRLDIRMAQAQLQAQAQSQGLELATSFTDIEIGIGRGSVADTSTGSSALRQSLELSLKLPVFDSGGQRRDGMQAQTLAAANRLEATVRSAGSHLRESYGAYRSAYAIARRYHDEVLPLATLIAEENLLRYNGMFIGVFELLAQTRQQIATVMAAIAADQQFWLAEAALQSSLTGRPLAAAMDAPSNSNNSTNTGHP